MGFWAVAIQASVLALYIGVSLVALYGFNQLEVNVLGGDYVRNVKLPGFENVKWPSPTERWSPEAECVEQWWCPTGFYMANPAVKVCRKVANRDSYNLTLSFTRNEIEGLRGNYSDESQRNILRQRRWPPETVVAISHFGMADDCFNFTVAEYICPITFTIATNPALMSCPLKLLTNHQLDEQTGLLKSSTPNERTYQLQEILTDSVNYVASCLHDSDLQRLQRNATEKDGDIGKEQDFKDIKEGDLCSSMVLKRRDDYELENSGSVFHLNATDIRFQAPFFAINPAGETGSCQDGKPKGLAAVCYPVARSIFECTQNENILVPTSSEEIVHHKNLVVYVIPSKQHILPGHYVKYADNNITHCAVVDDSIHPDAQKVYGSAAVISSIFLAVTLIISLLLPSINFHNKIMLCLAFSMFVWYLTYATRSFVSSFDGGICRTFFIFIYVASLSSFLWLNVLAYDLWRRLGTRNINFSSSGHHLSLRRLAAYASYSWGIPILFCIAVVNVEFNGKLHEFFDNGINFHQTCWYTRGKAIYFFFYGPIALILTENVVFFALTVWNLRKIGNEAKLVNADVHQRLLWVFLKLFVIMGILWFFELLSWVAGGKQSIWYFTDTINALQGFFIFMIYCFKKRTLQELAKVLRFSSWCPKSFNAQFAGACGDSQRSSARGDSSSDDRSRKISTTTMSTVLNRGDISSYNGNSPNFNSEMRTFQNPNYNNNSLNPNSANNANGYQKY